MPSFTLPSIEELQKNWVTVVEKMVNKYSPKDQNDADIPVHRLNQIKAIQKAFDAAEKLPQKDSQMYQVMAQNQIAANAQSLIIIGAMLEIQRQIQVKEFNSLTSKALSFVPYLKMGKVEGSELYSGLTAAMGVSAENVLDDDTRADAQRYYQQFVAQTNTHAKTMQAIQTFDRANLETTATLEGQRAAPYSVAHGQSEDAIHQKAMAEMMAQGYTKPENYDDIITGMQERRVQAIDDQVEKNRPSMYVRHTIKGYERAFENDPAALERIRDHKAKMVKFGEDIVSKKEGLKSVETSEKGTEAPKLMGEMQAARAQFFNGVAQQIETFDKSSLRSAQPEQQPEVTLSSLGL